MTDQQTGQKIQIVTAVDASGSPKQQFILTSPDGAGTGKVILASPETSSAKQLIFTTSDNLVPGRIQVRPVDRCLSQRFCCCACSRLLPLLWRPDLSLKVLWGPPAVAGCCLGSSENQQVRGKAQKAATAVLREGGDRRPAEKAAWPPGRLSHHGWPQPGEGRLVLILLGLASPLFCPCFCGLLPVAPQLWSLSLPWFSL